MWGSALFIPWTAAIADWSSKVEGRRGPLTSMIMLSGFANTMFTFYPLLWWLIATYRPETRAAELTFLLNGIAWLQFVGALSMAIFQWVAIGIAALSDRSTQPIMPRWIGFFSFWMAVLMLPGQIIFFFKTGPFAWNGLLALWIPAVAVGAWMVMISYYLIRANSKPAN